ncbi:ABC transporter permease [Microbulbifer flavimaris]|uniref:ABC transporter permease n=1 Tax=Microbulbifer flavimaris TaxID=1781068 RepID=A0ABX4HVC4_9GAMM|nr:MULTISPECIES: ABC transporter permease subunit [Microbulbifer]KUJ78773.1 transporter [Microbulbifer sp. ZGT114]PCO04064.1 ABC transporter permease [Microbulbifer flavimaris]
MSFLKQWLQGPMGALVYKESLEAWRDKRALLTAVTFALLFPVMITGTTVFVFKVKSENESRVALLGGEQVPLLAQRLAGDQLRVDVLQEGEPSALLAGEYDLVLQVGEDFVSQYREFGVPRLYVYMDGASKDASRARRQLQERLAPLQQQIVQQRAIARGVAPQLLAPWRLEVRDISTPSDRGKLILASVPALLIMTLFVASLATAVDASAGERERLSLENLLMQPLPPWQVVLAKTVAVASMGWLGGVLSVCALTALMPVMPLEELGMHQASSLSGVVTMGLLLMPLALLVAVVQLLLALGSKSFKDAQMRLSILQVAPLFMLMALDMSQVQLDKPIWQLLPLVGQQQWLKALLVGDVVSLPMVLAGSVVSLLLVAVFVLIGARALRRESLLGAT